MFSISIVRPHALSHSKAKDVAGRLAKDLETRFDLAWSWDGDDVRFQRPGLSGRMHVGKKTITLDVRLGFLLAAFKPVIEREIHAELDRLTGTRNA